jgi:TolB-like protein/cytochrome c-type biogenesis protein CcmH/NrfG
VLPFQNHGDDAREYLADGLTQDIINSLGRFSALTVMSWNAVAAYKGTVAKPAQIAHALAVRYQVEGSVRYSGDHVRVSAQLVDPEGRVLWSARFEEIPADVFALQDRITREIAGALAIRVTEFEQRRVSAKPTASFDAYDYVLRARPALQRPTRASIAEARELLRRAIELDPDYAAAHAALGESFHMAISMGWAESPDEYWKRVEAHAGEALRLDAANVRARILLARSLIAYNRYAEAQTQIDRAVAINPSDADALAGRGNILMWLGATDAAIETLELAQRIDPELNPFDRFGLSLAYYLKRRYAAAIEQAELNLRKYPGTHFNQVLLAAAYAQAGRAAEAARVAADIRRMDPTFEATAFGNKFLKPADLEHLREGLRGAGLLAREPAG